MAHINSDILRLGVDVGSTTVKAVALDPADNSVLFTRYQRHNAHQADTVRQLLEEAGVTITEMTDENRAAWKEKAQAFYELGDQFGWSEGLYEKVQEAMAE